MSGPDPVIHAPVSRFGAQRLYRDAGSMAVSQIGNATLGAGFWAIAAVTFEPDELGVMTAVLAVITATGLVLATGIGDAYTALLPAVGADRVAVYRRGQRLFFAFAVIGGLAAGFVTVSVLSEVRGSIAVGLLVAIGTLVSGLITLQNSTLAALGRARWLPAVNISVSVGKIILLPLLALTITWHPVELSFVIPAAVAVVVLRVVIARVVHSGEDLPAATVQVGSDVKVFNGFVAQTILSSGLVMGLLTLTPFLVTVFAGAKQGALFALVLTIVQALDLLGAALSMSLVVHASSAPELGGAMARAILIRIVLVSTIGAVVLVAVVPPVLSMLNPEYGGMGAAGVVAILAFGSVFRCTYQVWSGLQRARRQMTVPLILTSVSAVVLLASMPWLCQSYGALGGAMALMLAQSVLIVGIAIHFEVGRRRTRRGMVGDLAEGGSS